MGASVSKAGLLTLSGDLYEALSSPRAVHLMFDSSRGLIGLKPAPVEDETAYRITKPKHARTARVSCLALFNYYGIEHPETRAYPARIEDGVVVVDVSTAMGLRAVG